MGKHQKRRVKIKTILPHLDSVENEFLGEGRRKYFAPLFTFFMQKDSEKYFAPSNKISARGPSKIMLSNKIRLRENLIVLQ